MKELSPIAEATADPVMPCAQVYPSVTSPDYQKVTRYSIILLLSTAVPFFMIYYNHNDPF